MVDNKCEYCGGLMVEGIPGDIYCPEDECFQRNFSKALAMVRNTKEEKERKEYERLRVKYGTDGSDKG